MIDIHPPDHTLHTWRDFFIHVATICVGLLIAIGLEQTVEYIHHQQQVAEARRSLEVERKINVVIFATMDHEFRRYAPILRNNLAIFLYLRQHPSQHPNQPLPATLGLPDWTTSELVTLSPAWNQVQRNNVLDYMTGSELRNYGLLYSYLNWFNDAELKWGDALSLCTQYRIVDPDPSHLSPPQLDREIELITTALSTYSEAMASHADVNSVFPDFTPDTTANERALIQHLRDSPVDQQSLDAVNQEMQHLLQFEDSMNAADHKH